MNSTSLYVTRGLLLAAGLLATGIAATILAAPDPFYAGYGIDISSNVSLANELKAPAGALVSAAMLELALGAVCLLGFVRLRINARRIRITRSLEEAA